MPIQNYPISNPPGITQQSFDPSFGRALAISPNYSISHFSTQSSVPALSTDYWYLQFPRPNMGSAVHYRDPNTNLPDPDALRITLAWADCDQLTSLVFDTDDLHDHALAAYQPQSFVNLKWTFSLSFDANVTPFDAANGITLTVINAQGTSYVRLWNYKVPLSSGNNATFVLDFTNLRSGFAPNGPLVDPTTITQIFLTFSHPSYGSGLKLTDYVYSNVLFRNIEQVHSSDGSPALLSVAVPSFPKHNLQMTMGYDDLYNMTPKRLVDQMISLGYSTNCTLYIGMSHFMRLGWKPNESRFGYIFATMGSAPINEVSLAWFKDLYLRLREHNVNLIWSMSYEMLYEYIPYEWTQLDFQGNPALTGWSPPSSLMAFVNQDVMTHLNNTAAQCLSIQGSSDTKYFQIGEPWWWDGSFSTGHPCFYDPYTRAAFLQENQNATMWIFQSITEPVDTWQKQQTANWLQRKLGQSTQIISEFLKANFTNVKTGVLFFTPQAFGAQLTSIVNYPQLQWKHPNFDFFQVECYDTVTSGNIQLQDTQLRQVVQQLDYPFPDFQYFAGFVLYNQGASSEWPLIYQGMVDANRIGFSNIAIWSYSQIIRDSVLVYNMPGRRIGVFQIV